MTSPEPTPAEIEAAAREWCEMLFGEDSSWRLYKVEARALLALRAKDKAEAAARIAELEMALSACVTSMERLDFSEGVCCCGDPVETHGMGSGHTPVDAGDYYASKALEAARAALAAAPEKQG